MPQIGAKTVRHPQRLGGAGERGDMARMAARDRHRVRAPPIDFKMHRHFERRRAVAGHLPARRIEFDQGRVRHQPERAARRDQNAIAARHAGADMTEALHDPEIGEHPAGGEHIGAQFGSGGEGHVATLSNSMLSSSAKVDDPVTA
jgi:hypothetical protein